MNNTLIFPNRTTHLDSILKDLRATPSHHSHHPHFSPLKQRSLFRLKNLLNGRRGTGKKRVVVFATEMIPGTGKVNQRP
jgi:hypothetical protein